MTLEERTTKALRSKPAAVIGLLVGLASAGLVASSLVRAILRGRTLIEEQTVGSIALASVGFALFQLFAVASLHAVGGRPAARLWASSQLAKYLPAPGAALGGMVHSSIRHGGTAGAAIRLTLRHSALLVGTAVAVGSVAFGKAAHERFDWPGWIPVAILLPAGAALTAFSTRGLAQRDRRNAAAAAIAAWVFLGSLLWAGIARHAPGGTTIASAFPAAWALGFLALPVPAGIGIREAVLVVLLQPLVGSAGAASFAVLSRILHVASDAAIIGVSTYVGRRKSRG